MGEALANKLISHVPGGIIVLGKDCGTERNVPIKKSLTLF